MKKSKIRKVIILPNSEAIKYKPLSPTAAIRIFDAMKGQYGPKGKLQRGYVRTFCYTFDDVDILKHTNKSLKKTIKSDGIKKIFDKPLAAEIILSFEKVMDICDALMIHCHAGAGRSPAVAAALMDIYRIRQAVVPLDMVDDFAPEGSGLVTVRRQAIEDNFTYNRWVYNLLVEAAEWFSA